MTTLYKIASTGAVQIWEINECGEDEIEIEWSQLGGAKQYKYETVELNQSGRSLPEQMRLRIDSRVNGQLDKGYCTSIDEARSSIGLNAQKLQKPMLACKISDFPNLNLSNHFVQYKYNGHRCLITNDGEQNIAYSRNGKEIKTISHILDGLNLDKGQTLDGELYVHGKKLQNIGSLVKKIQPDNKHLNYIVYDTITPDSYEKRLDRLIKAQFNENITVAPTRYGNTIKSMAEELTGAILDGYEGLMLRANDTGYQVGKRSKSLIKVKQALDSEFIVIDIIPSVDGWGILECLVDIKSKKTFRVSAPGTIQDKTNILINKHKHIGSIVNVEFFEWTNDGKPFHPVAMYFREEE